MDFAPDTDCRNTLLRAPRIFRTSICAISGKVCKQPSIRESSVIVRTVIPEQFNLLGSLSRYLGYGILINVQQCLEFAFLYDVRRASKL